MLGFLAIVLGLCAGGSLGASNRGKEFWVSYMYHDRGSSEGRNSLWITTTDQAANVQIECPFSNINFTTYIPAESSFYQPFAGNVRVEEGIEMKGIRITADVYISVHGVNAVDGTIDGFVAVAPLPHFTRFVLASYNPLATRYSQFIINGIQDNTNVTIWRRATSGYVFLDTFNISSFQTNVFGSNSVDYTGAYVESDKPISVFSGHECANVPVSVTYCDMITVNVPPIGDLGLDFIVPPIDGRSFTAGYRIRIVSAYDNTTVLYGKEEFTQTNTLHMGQFWELDTTETRSYRRVSCSMPCMVVQYNKGGTQDSIATDPFMMLVTPLIEYSAQVGWTPVRRFNDLPFNNYVSVICQNQSLGDLRLDGSSIGGWQGVGNTGYSFTSLSVSAFNHTLYNSDPASTSSFAAFAYGHSGTNEEAYGFQAGYGVPRDVVPTNPPTSPSTSAPPTFPPGSDVPVLDIVLNGTFYTHDGSYLEPGCVAEYSEEMARKNLVLALIINEIMGTELCQGFTGTELTTTDNTFIAIGNDGLVGVGVLLPGRLDKTFGEMHNCGREIITYMGLSDNWGLPILDQVPGCPFLLFQPERFDHSDWIWKCVQDIKPPSLKQQLEELDRKIAARRAKKAISA